jgi:hypothetical protein
MRMTPRQSHTLAVTVRRHFGAAARLWAFSSRLDDAARGGEFDILVRSEAADAQWLCDTILPGLLIATLDPLPPELTFAEKLQRLERLGAVPDAARWHWLREVSNSLAHGYPENPPCRLRRRPSR